MVLVQEVRIMIRRINHITFAVSDLKETASFYENILGLKKTEEWSNYVLFLMLEEWS